MNLNVRRLIVKRTSVSIVLATFLFALQAKAQNIFMPSNETFPTAYNNSAAGNQNTTFTGDMGTWQSFSNTSYASVAVINYYYNYSAPNCLFIKNFKGTNASLSQATSPAVDLSGFSCSPKVWLSLNIDISKLDGGNTGTVYKFEFSNNGGTTWTTVWQQTAAQLKANYSSSGFNNTYIAITSTYLVSNFKYRISGSSPANTPYNSEFYVDDLQIFADACRTTWTNTCSDNKDVDYYAKGMKSACVGGSQGWTNIGAAENLNMTNANKVVAYVSMSQSGTPAQTVTIRSKNSAGTVLQTITATLVNNEPDPSDINIYEATFTSLTNVVSFEASISGGCSVSSSTNPSYIANGLGLAVFRNGVTGNYNTGKLAYWGSVGYGTNDLYETFDLPTPSYNKKVFVTVGVSGLTATPGKDAEIIVSYYDTLGNPKDTTIFITDNTPNGDRIVTRTVAVDVVSWSSSITVRTDYIPNAKNDLYSVDFIKVRTACNQPLNLGNLVWIDANNNGIKDAGENGLAGATVNLYQDSNGDNTPDGAVFATTATDANGNYSFAGLAAGNYIVGVTIPAGYGPAKTTASSTNPNNDTDNDNNGVTKSGSEIRSNYITLSAGGEPANDGDGSNGNLTLDFAIAKDTDGDGVADWKDIDDDNDGITDLNESGGYDPLGDCDGDGIPNYKDPTPGCTTPSGNDPWGVPYKPLTWTDCNSDGINDFFDWDRDGIINELDLDSDNDGILDVQEARPNGVAITSTSNGMITGTDADGNGLLSSYDNGNTNPVLNGVAAQDLDRDGTPNFLDLDSDGDGITDATEAFGTYDSDGLANGTDTDGDGVRAENFGSNTASTADNINGFGAKGFTLLDTDGDGKPNAYDIDSDNDGITDNTEGQPTCTNKLPAMNDCDGDGVDDNYDVTGGCASCTRTSGGITPYDKDGDGTPDYLDGDTDNDGISDIYEATTLPDGNGGHTYPGAGYWTGATGDADGDGLMDYFDGFNIKTQTANFPYNVITNNLGTNGVWATPSPTGSNAQVPESDGLGGCPNGGERDWRSSSSVLPVTLIEFKGNLNGTAVSLNWTVASETNMLRYEPERSTDGITYVKTGTVNAANASVTKTYLATDNIGNLSATTIYYRLKMLDRNGSAKYSNIIVFDVRKTLHTVSVHPNPANTYFTVTIKSNKEANSIIRVTDISGKVVLTKSVRLLAGINAIPFADLKELTNGVYSVLVLTDENAVIEKLLINR